MDQLTIMPCWCPSSLVPNECCIDSVYQEGKHCQLLLCVLQLVAHTVVRSAFWINFLLSINFVPGSNGGWMKLVVVVAKLGEKMRFGLKSKLCRYRTQTDGLAKMSERLLT